MLTDNDILENRKTVIAYLKNKNLRKATGILRGVGGGRCCLGHMCDALGIQPNKVGDMWQYLGEAWSLPNSVADQLGMHDEDGAFRMESGHRSSYQYKKDAYAALSVLNDSSDIRPWEIGEILEGMIMGGDRTPWRTIHPTTESEVFATTESE